MPPTVYKFAASSGPQLADACVLMRCFCRAAPYRPRHLSGTQVELFGSTTIRFPDEPITLRTIYEWLQADGETWVKRKVVGYANPPPVI